MMTKERAYAVCEALEKKFAENDRTYWEVGVELDPANRYFIRVAIDNGDWKHDHLFANYLIAETLDALGIKFTQNTAVTEEDGSDCYSADHIIRFIEED